MKGRLLLILTILLFTFSGLQAQQACLNKAWKAFGEENYEDAIKHCDECIETFGEAATKMQSELEAAGNKNGSFPSGVPSEEMKDKIFSNWAVNDVSTAYYVRGLAAEKHYRATGDKTYKEMAKESFKETCSFPFGRCWDEQGWFWSPCEAAQEKL